MEEQGRNTKAQVLAFAALVVLAGKFVDFSDLQWGDTAFCAGGREAAMLSKDTSSLEQPKRSAADG